LLGILKAGAAFAVRTPYLAKGYLGDEQLTKDRFILNPFTKEAGDRLYRTGDLGRYLPDGAVEFAGRNDRQVKIRGFRIEPEEIEAALAQHEAVREAVVVAREDERGDRSLAAYVVPDHRGGDISARDVRNFLREELPEYMVPSAFVRIEAVPLTPNGKVDRRALPRSGRARPETARTPVSPRNHVETALAVARGQADEMTRMLAEVEGLSDEDARRLFVDRGTDRGGRA